jgi:hypothetical protein
VHPATQREADRASERTGSAHNMSVQMMANHGAVRRILSDVSDFKGMMVTRWWIVSIGNAILRMLPVPRQ